MLDTEKFNCSIEQLPEDLRTLAEVELSNARRQLERRGRLAPRILMRAADGEMVPYQMSDEQADILFGHSEAKKQYTAMLRHVVKMGHITAVVMVNDIWGGRPTEKFNSLPAAERKRTFDNIRNINQGIKEGWMTRCEAVLVTIQTAEYVALVQQEYIRDNAAHRIIWLDRDAGLAPQADFTGGMKMYGRDDASC